MKQPAAYLAFSALSLCLLSAQASAPFIGVARFADGTLRAVHGLPDNLLVASQPLASADCASFSDYGGLVSLKGMIRLLGRDGQTVAEYASGESKPVLSIDGALNTALAWLPSKRLLLHWNGRDFLPTAVAYEEDAGGVRQLAWVNQNKVRLLAGLGSGSTTITVSLATGRVDNVEVLPIPGEAAFWQQGFLVSQSAHGLTVESATGLQRSVPLSADPLQPGDLVIERMSADWLHISSSNTNRNWALLLNKAKLQVSVMPAPAMLNASKQQVAQ